MKSRGIATITFAVIALGLLTVSTAFAYSAREVPNLGVIATAENSYYNNHGSYFQVLPNQQLPSHQPGVLSDYVDPRAVPPNTRIDVYAGPAGSGYSVQWTIPATTCEAGLITSVGYGPEASERSFVIILPVLEVSTSTPATICRGDLRSESPRGDRERDTHRNAR